MLCIADLFVHDEWLEKKIKISLRPIVNRILNSGMAESLARLTRNE